MDTLHVRVEMNDSDDSEASETSLESEVRRKNCIGKFESDYLYKSQAGSIIGLLLISILKFPLQRCNQIDLF